MEWRVIPKYKGKYEVSEDGKVRNSKGKILTNSRRNKAGYRRAALYMHGEPKEHLIHRLVAKYHIGYPPTSGHYVNHKDRDKLNNHVSNLEWVTPSQNTKHYYNSLKVDEGDSAY